MGARTHLLGRERTGILHEIDGTELPRKHIVETAWRIIGRAYKKPGKGQSCRKFWSDSPAIPETFVPCHSFAGNLVGPSAVHASRVECAMEIDHQLIFRSQTHDFLVPVHHLLVLSIHEIDFESIHTTL